MKFNIVLCLYFTLLHSSYAINVYVLDKESREPIESVNVFSGNQGITTNFEGFCNLGIFNNDQIGISKDIQDYISTEITTSIRELVGAINRIISFSRIYNKAPNLAETKVILKDLLNISENKVTIDLIQTLVCRFFKISKNEMLSSRRSRYLVRPRQTAIYLTKILTSKSLPEIGREFSNRDHTTIIHSVKTIEKLKEKEPEMVENINKLKNQILYNNKENEI